MSKPYIITIDQGTTGSRVFLIDEGGQVLASAYQEFTQYYPQPGWVEHDPAEIWHSIAQLYNEARIKAKVSVNDALGIGITNQRETTVLFEKASGDPIYKAIVWQCRRTADFCSQLKQQGLAESFRQKTGLVLDAYFSGSKVKWILDNVAGARKRALNGEILFGTIDSYLLYKLTGEHATDYTNASRTLLFDIHQKQWSPELCKILDVPLNILPRVQNSASLFGKTKGLTFLPDGIPVYSLIGDQQSALFGQGCFDAGEAKNTYGTGCFFVMNTGMQCIDSQNGLLTTLACDAQGRPSYALEGSVFIGGAVVQYLRDNLKFFQHSYQSQDFALAVDHDDDVVFVPAFAGLGAPYWNQQARGAIFGLSRDTTPQQITRAALKSIALQSYDLIEAMQKDSKLTLQELKVDGGATQNEFLMNYQAAILQIPVVRPANVDTTVMGAAYLAGLAAQVWSSAQDLKKLNPPAKKFEPTALNEMYAKKNMKFNRDKELLNWQQAIGRINV